MTVQELIEKLQKFPPDHEVALNDWEESRLYTDVGYLLAGTDKLKQVDEFDRNPPPGMVGTPMPRKINEDERAAMVKTVWIVGAI